MELTINESLSDFLHSLDISLDLKNILVELSVAGVSIAEQLYKGYLSSDLGCTTQSNVQGEVQKKMDVASNDLLKQSLGVLSCVKGLASEEEEMPVACHDKGDYLVLFDPLDGSSNIDVNVTVGTIFSVLKAPNGSDASKVEPYLQPGNQQVAAGYLLYGPSTLLVLTIGRGVHFFSYCLDKKIFLLIEKNVSILEYNSKEFAINMSNQRFWLPEMQRYVSDVLKGELGPLKTRYNMRWIASMVAEIHRILVRGGLFMYPYDNRIPERAGKLRLMYEANPMGWLVEQAGGKASTAFKPILSIQPTSIHQRVSVVMGSRCQVDEVINYHKK